ncbi:MAG: hypothetical protein PT939_05105 [Aerococcus suis]|nr:hypothetical protein [Aerococcus suis]
MKKIIKVILWFAVILALLSFLSPVVLIGGAIAIFWYTKKNPNEKRRNIAIGMTVLGLLGTIFLGYSATQDNTPDTPSTEEVAESTSKQIEENAEDQASAKSEVEEKSENEESKEESSEKESQNPEIEVTATEVIDTFENNEIKGKEEYTGKRARITGVVDDVGESFGQTYVTLRTESNEFAIIGLQCYFDKDNQDGLGDINTGDEITLEGTIGEQSMNIAVDDCVLI